MTKILNLDVVKPPVERALKLNGVKHEMAAFSVGDFIEHTRNAKRFAEQPDTVEELELLLSMVGRTFPTIPETELRALKFEQLQAILSWSQDDSVTEGNE